MSRLRRKIPDDDDGLETFWTDANPRGCGWGLCSDNREHREHSHPARRFLWCEDETCPITGQHAHQQQSHRAYVPLPKTAAYGGYGVVEYGEENR